jgi:hypothetical protein
MIRWSSTYRALISSRTCGKDFQRRFPQVRLDINALYVDDQRIITSAGTAAALGAWPPSRCGETISRRAIWLAARLP